MSRAALSTLEAPGKEQKISSDVAMIISENVWRVWLIHGWIKVNMNVEYCMAQQRCCEQVRLELPLSARCGLCNGRNGVLLVRVTLHWLRLGYRVRKRFTLWPADFCPTVFFTTLSSVRHGWFAHAISWNPLHNTDMAVSTHVTNSTSTGWLAVLSQLTNIS